MLQGTDSESEESAPELVGDDENRLSDDEEFPISEDEDDEMEDEEMEVETDNKKQGWADSMAKILKSDKTGVLSKAKKIEDIEKKKEKKPYTFEIDGADEDAEEKKPDETALERAMAKKRYREKREVMAQAINSKLFTDISHFLE